MATFSKAVFYKRTYNIVLILFGLMDNLVNVARAFTIHFLQITSISIFKLHRYNYMINNLSYL